MPKILVIFSNVVATEWKIAEHEKKDIGFGSGAQQHAFDRVFDSETSRVEYSSSYR
jgi:hypothetical protein